MGELKQRGRIWWLRYYRNGKRHEESSGSSKKGEAQRLLQLREGDIARGVPVSSQIGRLRFDEAAQDVVNDYRINGKKSVDELERRIRLHLEPVFGGRRMASLTTADVRAFVAKRQSDTIVTRRARQVKKHGTVTTEPEIRRSVSNAEINRELTTFKRIFSLAIQGGKLLQKPHIPLLREDNVRLGFFEPEQFASLLRHMPDEVQPILRFAYVTGWRIASEVLPLQWRQVDFRGGEVRLNPGTTKNRDGRVFPLTDELRALLTAQEAHTQALGRQQGRIIPWVFHRDGEPVKAFRRAWAAACVKSGLPGRIPHDLRRTAVRNMVRRGVPERVAMKLTGHKTPSVFARYDITSSSDLTNAAEKLSGLMTTGTVWGQSAPSAPIAAGEKSLK